MYTVKPPILIKIIINYLTLIMFLYLFLNPYFQFEIIINDLGIQYVMGLQPL